MATVVTATTARQDRLAVQNPASKVGYKLFVPSNVPNRTEPNWTEEGNRSLCEHYEIQPPADVAAEEISKFSTGLGAQLPKAATTLRGVW